MTDYLKFFFSTIAMREQSEIIVWGGPVVTFRIEAVNSIDFNRLSVREIDPSKKKQTR
ncbi:MAG TPA: hypothetical protein VE076_06595 [Nitrososphaeraceae archaeon]|nr:hypothetical protein [Nitrososphaeraceae archaeon]